MSTAATPCRVENCPNAAGRDGEGVCEAHYAEHVGNLRADVTHHPGNGPKVLVVEDDPLVRRMFVDCLREIGQFDIRDTGSSLAAIQAVRDERPDVITTDVKRPRMDGLETVEHIRKIEGADKVWIIGISGMLADADCKEHALTVGCNECLVKPIDRESFREAIIKGIGTSGMLDGRHGVAAFRACYGGRCEDGGGRGR